MKIAVLITTFNRSSVTLRGLRAFFDAVQNQHIGKFEVYLVDDASPDRTGHLVKERFPTVRVIQGTGKLFWNRGMCRAYACAKAQGPFDAYLLLNDDVVLMHDGLQRMLSTYKELNRNAFCAVTGPMLSPSTRKTTYGAFTVTARYRPATFESVHPDGTLRECATFNGNCVLVPARLMDEVGGLDPAYHHSYGDIDLGLALGKRGCKTYLMPSHVGYCEANIRTPPPPFYKRIQLMFTPPRPISDQIHLAFRRYPRHVAIPISIVQIVRRLFEVLFPQRN